MLGNAIFGVSGPVSIFSAFFLSQSERVGLREAPACSFIVLLPSPSLETRRWGCPVHASLLLEGFLPYQAKAIPVIVLLRSLPATYLENQRPFLTGVFYNCAGSPPLSSETLPCRWPSSSRFTQSYWAVWMFLPGPQSLLPLISISLPILRERKRFLSLSEAATKLADVWDTVFLASLVSSTQALLKRGPDSAES